ncbi:MAG: hypothetical protein Q9160_002518 [Pyrenula sp. 1 TL-2023]
MSSGLINASQKNASDIEDAPLKGKADDWGDDTDARDKALVSLKFLLLSPLSTNNHFLGHGSPLTRLPAVHRTSNNIYDRFCTYETFKALIDCLVKFLAAHEASASDPKHPVPFISATSPIHPAHRPFHERTALTILNNLIYRDLPNALRCGIVSRWLSKYPFPCAEQSNPGSREDVQELSDTWWQDDPVMSEIVRFISRDPAGKLQLRQYGLMSKGLRGGHGPEIDGENDNISLSESSSDDDVRMADGDDTAGLPPRWDPPLTPRPGTSHGQPRPREGATDSTEEQSLRHRRREAIVISDGNGPLGRENIIEPSVERERVERERQSETDGDIDREQDNASQSSLPLTAGGPAFMAFGPNNTIIVGDGLGEVLRESDQFVVESVGALHVEDAASEEGDLEWRRERETIGDNSAPQEGEEENSGRPRRQSLNWVNWVRERWTWGES